MSKRGDNIHKRKDGRWEGRYTKGRKEAGKIRYGSVYGKTYREVKEKLSEISTDNSQSLISKNRNIYFKEVLLLWMENNKLRLKGGTINKYQNLIDTHILPELGGIRLSELTSTTINSFLSKKKASEKSSEALILLGFQ